MRHMTDAASAADANELARECARAMFDADAASRALGMEMVDAAAGRATVRMTITARMLNGHRIGHGGYTFMLADTAFALACNGYGIVTVAAACDIVFTAPTHEGDLLEAVAIERLRAGRRGVYDVTVSRVDGETPAVVAEFRGVSRSTSGTVLGRTPTSGPSSEGTHAP